MCRSPNPLLLHPNPTNLDPLPKAGATPNPQPRDLNPSPKHSCQDRADEGGGAERKVRRITVLCTLPPPVLIPDVSQVSGDLRGREATSTAGVEEALQGCRGMGFWGFGLLG